ncbi:MAG: hypothetical protein WCI72_06000 [archaeon]
MVRKKTVKKVVKENPNRAVEKQFFWLVGIIIVITLSFVFVPMLYHKIFEKFEYGGVNFEKVKTGKLVFYHGQFPVIYKGELSVVYNVYLRNDPRKNNIPITTNLSLSRKVSVSLNNDVNLCKDMVLGQSEIGKFLPAFPFIKNISAGVVNGTTAKEMNLTQITCKNASADNTVIIIQNSETPSIDAGETENCFLLNIGKCQYLPTVERYVVGVMAQINGKTLN